MNFITLLIFLFIYNNPAFFCRAAGYDGIKLSETVSLLPVVREPLIPTYNINKVRNISKRSPQLVRELLNRHRQGNTPRISPLGIAASIASGVQNAVHSVGDRIADRINRPANFGIKAQFGNTMFQSMLQHGIIPNFNNNNYNNNNYGAEYLNAMYQSMVQQGIIPNMNNFPNNGQNNGHHNQENNTNVVGYLEDNFPVILLKENEIR